MSESAAAIPVLEYARAKPSHLRRLARAALFLGIVLAGAAAGGLVGRAAAPVTFTVRGAYQLRLDVPSGLERAEDVMQRYERHLRAHIGWFRTPEALDAIAAGVASRGHALPPPPGQHEWLRRNLTLRHLPNSEVVLVSFRSRDESLADDVVDAALAVAETRPTFGGMRPQGRGRSRARVSRNPAFAGGGAIAGAVAATVGLWLWRGARAKAHAVG